MRLTKIYTRTGDSGTTRLADGSKISKTDLRIEAYGNVDELNSFVGLLSDHLRSDTKFLPFVDRLLRVQHELFDIGGELATPPASFDPKAAYLVHQDAIDRLEQEIDTMNEALSPLKNFVLPGGHLANSTAHVCRTICRRTERLLVKLKDCEEIRSEPLSYLNRLSDWLFVFSRRISLEAGVSEVLWNQKK